MPTPLSSGSGPFPEQIAEEGGHFDGAQPERGACVPSVDASRRRLLKIGVYTAPLVAGTLLVSKDALAQEGSCIPYGGACAPRGGPCVPASPCRPAGAPCAPEWLKCGPDICLPTIFG